MVRIVTMFQSSSFGLVEPVCPLILCHSQVSRHLRCDHVCRPTNQIGRFTGLFPSTTRPYCRQTNGGALSTGSRGSTIFTLWLALALCLTLECEGFVRDSRLKLLVFAVVQLSCRDRNPRLTSGGFRTVQHRTDMFTPLPSYAVRTLARAVLCTCRFPGV